MIITLEEVKALLQKNDTTQDTLINTLIPICEEAICEYCRNNFVNRRYRIISSDISFDTDNNKIILGDSITHYFEAGDTIHIACSFRNNGKLSIESVEDNILTINSLYSIKVEPVDQMFSVHILKVEYPKTVKRVISNMIHYNISKLKPGITSETIRNYSVTFNNASYVNGYPKDILSDLNAYKLPYWSDV